MKWAASVLVGVSMCLGAQLAHAYNFPAGQSNPRQPAPVVAPKSLEEPPDDQQPVARKGAPAHDPNKSFSLTFSPLHLILPVFLVSAEVKPVPHLGLTFSGGYGSITVEQPSSNGFSTDEFSAGALLLSARFACYWRKFDGFVGGVQTLYVHIDGTGTASNTAFAGTGSGLAWDRSLVTSGRHASGSRCCLTLECSTWLSAPMPTTARGRARAPMRRT